MLLKQLHDQRSTLVQSPAQRRVRDPVQVSHRNLALQTWGDRELRSGGPWTPVLRSSPGEDLPVLSKVKMSPSHLAALFGVFGSELQLERRRVFLRGELGSSDAASSSEGGQRRKSYN